LTCKPFGGDAFGISGDTVADRACGDTVGDAVAEAVSEDDVGDVKSNFFGTHTCLVGDSLGGDATFGDTLEGDTFACLADPLSFDDGIDLSIQRQSSKVAK
jgi:hypothetical protein